MANNNLNRMFNPRGIAIVGASGDDERPGGQALNALLVHGYSGRIFPVNPKYESIAGLRCYPSLASIDGECDLAVIALPARLVPQAIEQCGAKSIGNAVVISGGFREVGADGARIEQQLIAAAHAGTVRVIGPNCLGFVNVHDNVYGGFGSITRPPKLQPGAVSVVIQSGGFGNSIVMQAAAAGIGFRYVVASGMETDVNAAELIDAFVADPGTKVIFAYLEGIPDGRQFMAAARRALAAEKPIIVLKGGNTGQGLKAAASHTASMTSSHEIYRAAFRQTGIIEARDIGETVDYLQSVLHGRPMRGRRVAVLGASGGSAVNFCDAADEYGLTVGKLSPETETVLGEILPDIGSVRNPIDFTAGFFNESNQEEFRRCLSTLLHDDGIDAVGYLAATAIGTGLERLGRNLKEVLKETSKPVMIFSSATYETAPKGLDLLKELGLPVLTSPRRVAACMSMLANYSEAQNCHARFSEEEAMEHKQSVESLHSRVTGEYEAKRLLSEHGIPSTKDFFLALEKAASPSLPHGLAYPVAVKIVSPDIAHKSDIGAVQLNIASDSALKKAIGEVIENSKAAHPNAKLSGVLVSEMVKDGLEAIVGVVNDRVFGPVVAVGLGGIFAETLRDMAYRVAPFGVETAREMISELRGAALFGSVRGTRPRDVEALVHALVDISTFAWRFRADLAEMDINPLLVMPQGKGVMAADALIVWSERARPSARVAEDGG